MDEDFDDIKKLTIQTKYYKVDYFSDKRCLKKIEIYPSDGIWNLTNLAVFLNEFRFLQIGHTAFIKKGGLLTQILKFHFIYSAYDFFIVI